MAEQVAPAPRVFEGIVAKAARLLARGVYRSVEVDNQEPGWSNHPVLLVANHPTGFADPALLLGLLGRSPRFLAKSTLWNARIVGWFLDRLGAIPVYRAQDGPRTSRNVEMFSAAIAALDRGETIAMFPEGRMHDEPFLAPLKTGAARLVLGAHGSGVAGLHVVPAGIHFEDKAAVRARAYVEIGDVLEVDPEVGGIIGGAEPSAEDHEAVRRLTMEIEDRLQRVAPRFADEGEAGALALAAEVALRVPDGPRRVSYANRQRVAGRLARRPESDRRVIARHAGVYHAELAESGVRDADLIAQSRNRLPQRFVRVLVALVLLAPFALAGLVMNLVPYLLLRAAGGLRITGMSPTTIRMAAAVAAFGLAWLLWAVLAGLVWSWQLGLITLVAAPLYGWVAVWVLDGSMEWWRDWSGLRRARRLGATTETLLAHRHRLVAAVDEALRT